VSCLDLEGIYSKYSKDVYLFCLSLCSCHATAEDITSETFIKAIKSFGSFRGQCSVRVWLCQIAKNTYYDSLRKHSKKAELSGDIQDENDFENDLLEKDEALRIHKLLHKLDDPYKEVFTLRVFAELSFSDIGKIFLKTESWARVTFHRARLKLKESSLNGKM
jgi:RNA polymerase sigma-70 factor (ECF subfamily)